MSIYDILLLISFFAAFAILFYKIYNILSECKIYDLRQSILLFCLYYLFYGIAFVSAMFSVAIAPEKMILITLFDLLSWTQLLNIAFIFIELFYRFKINSGDDNKAYQPKWYWDNK